MRKPSFDVQMLTFCLLNQHNNLELSTLAHIKLLVRTISLLHLEFQIILPGIHLFASNSLNADSKVILQTERILFFWNEMLNFLETLLLLFSWH